MPINTALDDAQMRSRCLAADTCVDVEGNERLYVLTFASEVELWEYEDYGPYMRVA